MNCGHGPRYDDHNNEARELYHIRMYVCHPEIVIDFLQKIRAEFSHESVESFSSMHVAYH